MCSKDGIESLLDKYHAYCLPIVARLHRSNIATASPLSPTPICGIPRHAVQTCSQRFPQQRAYSLSSRIVDDELCVRRFSQRKRQHRFSIKRIGKILSQVRGIGQSAALDNGRTRFVLDWNSVVVEQDLLAYLQRRCVKQKSRPADPCRARPLLYVPRQTAPGAARLAPAFEGTTGHSIERATTLHAKRALR